MWQQTRQHKAERWLLCAPDPPCVDSSIRSRARAWLPQNTPLRQSLPASTPTTLLSVHPLLPPPCFVLFCRDSVFSRLAFCSMGLVMAALRSRARSLRVVQSTPIQHPRTSHSLLCSFSSLSFSLPPPHHPSTLIHLGLKACWLVNSRLEITGVRTDFWIWNHWSVFSDNLCINPFQHLSVIFSPTAIHQEDWWKQRRTLTVCNTHTLAIHNFFCHWDTMNWWLSHDSRA